MVLNLCQSVDVLYCFLTALVEQSFVQFFVGAVLRVAFEFDVAGIAAGSVADIAVVDDAVAGGSESVETGLDFQTHLV